MNNLCFAPDPFQEWFLYVLFSSLHLNIYMATCNIFIIIFASN